MNYEQYFIKFSFRAAPQPPQRNTILCDYGYFPESGVRCCEPGRQIVGSGRTRRLPSAQPELSWPCRRLALGHQYTTRNQASKPRRRSSSFGSSGIRGGARAISDEENFRFLGRRHAQRLRTLRHRGGLRSTVPIVQRLWGDIRAVGCIAIRKAIWARPSWGSRDPLKIIILSRVIHRHPMRCYGQHGNWTFPQTRPVTMSSNAQSEIPLWLHVSRSSRLTTEESSTNGMPTFSSLRFETQD
jgi:hypothetical protein